MEQQGQFRVTGVVLHRKDLSSSLRTLYLWCREKGPFWVFAPGSGRGKISRGYTEPLVWGEFHLYKSPRGIYLKVADLREDFWDFRKSPRKMREALQWAGLLKKNLLAEHPEDALLRVFYWSLILLREGAPLPPLRWRFLWKWLSLWGRAPDLWRCEHCGKLLEENPAYTQGARTGFLCPLCGNSSGGLEATLVLQELRKAVMLSRSDFRNYSFTLTPLQWEEKTKILEELVSDRI
ncbi:MAG TPA: DNA repair protein RecO C-terminal domain-containing protein [Synergistaceae bacterium]|nr:DNA repair protein RecO C-terminal domain-containing protein [Synergistaceae bacterium]HPJ26455.1 DNA repair protein RecO C-terminal domain-containing protein [Synergistaceae bacterium]HPQ37323.1 DNA repair protein RecO C-terminal domain-containing protein [Synergistaceae bacterium]